MGGRDAPIMSAESVAGMRMLVDTFGMGMSGRFFRYSGARFPGKQRADHPCPRLGTENFFSLHQLARLASPVVAFTRRTPPWRSKTHALTP